MINLSGMEKIKDLEFKISKRTLANKELLRILDFYLDSNPQLRFGQALVNLGIIQQEMDRDKGILSTKDPYYVEPVDMLDLIKQRNPHVQINDIRNL